jgi:hypothetical protein
MVSTQLFTGGDELLDVVSDRDGNGSRTLMTWHWVFPNTRARALPATYRVVHQHPQDERSSDCSRSRDPYRGRVTRGPEVLHLSGGGCADFFHACFLLGA